MGGSINTRLDEVIVELGDVLGPIEYTVGVASIVAATEAGALEVVTAVAAGSAAIVAGTAATTAAVVASSSSLDDTIANGNTAILAALQLLLTKTTEGVSIQNSLLTTLNANFATVIANQRRIESYSSSILDELIVINTKQDTLTTINNTLLAQTTNFNSKFSKLSYRELIGTGAYAISVYDEKKVGP